MDSTVSTVLPRLSRCIATELRLAAVPEGRTWPDWFLRRFAVPSTFPCNIPLLFPWSGDPSTDSEHLHRLIKQALFRKSAAVCISLHVSRFKSPAFNVLQVTPDQWQRFDCTLPKEAATDEPNFQDSVASNFDLI